MDFSSILLNLVIFSLPLIAFIYLLMGIKLFKKKSDEKHTPSSFLMFAIAIYLLGYFLELNSLSNNAFFISRLLKYLGLAFIPSLGILFVSELTRYSQSRGQIFFLLSLSSLTWLLFLTDPIHHLVYRNISFQRIGGFSISNSLRGLGYYLLMVYFLIYIGFSTILLIKRYHREKSLRIKHGYLLLLASLHIFWIAILFFFFQFSGIGTTISLLVSSFFLIGFSAIKSDIFELEMRRWKQIFSSIEEIAFLADLEKKILCLNIVAQNFFTKEDLRTLFKDIEEAHAQRNPLKINLKDDARWFHINRTSFDFKNELVSYVLIDFTRQYQSQEEIYHLSYHDHLTGLYNRRYFEQALKQLDTPENLPLSLIIADINGLKLINDSFGRLQGDLLLKKAAKLMKNNIPENAVLARISGGEFMIILPQVDIFDLIETVKALKNATSKVASEISISYGCETKEIESQDMQDIFKQAEDDMYRHKVYESTSSKNKTIGIIMNTLYEKSNREMLHSKRVSGLCESIATEMKLSRDTINQIGVAGLMHDIGKIGIDEKILNKEGPLNFEEWQEIQKHPEIGYRILNSASEFSEISRYVLEHHERWDGKGYPRKIKGEDISLQSRIIGIADAYDAMTSDRTYRKGLSKDQAIQELRRNAGSQFDPQISKLFIEKVLQAGD